ncbi:MAG: DUF1573 domain-containing protein [Aliifodinibius sp.]|nr:DUF1573 domain-containing protein [Fodinibius sp.]NIV14373.1 DUF1573 domain-containing protein [Fodinibius sp.]NIY28192.1 DUF1573 domain-containing protein [Fodinibius sp.]
MRFSALYTKLQLTLLFAVSIWPGNLLPAAGNLSGPVFYVSQRNIELGRLSPNEKRPFSLRIGNKGKETLIIHSVSANCGCISPAKKWKDVELQPGESKQVQFYLLAEEKGRGGSAKTIMFKTSDPHREYLPVVVRYAVKPDYRVVALPAKLDFRRVKPEKRAALKMTIISPYPEPLDVNSIECSNSSILIHPMQSNGRPDVISYTVELPVHLKPGPISELITINTAIGKIDIPIEGYKTGIIDCTPSDIIFEPARVGESTETCLVVKNTTGKKFRLLKATAETEQIQVKVETGPNSLTTHRLRLRFMPVKARKGLGHSRILIVTDKFGLNKVNCTYFVH